MSDIVSTAEKYFIISDGHVSVIFDKYEIAAGMAGMFVVTLPDPLKSPLA